MSTPTRTSFDVLAVGTLCVMAISGLGGLIYGALYPNDTGIYSSHKTESLMHRMVGAFVCGMESAFTPPILLVTGIPLAIQYACKDSSDVVPKK